MLFFFDQNGLYLYAREEYHKMHLFDENLKQ